MSECTTTTTIDWVFVSAYCLGFLLTSTDIVGTVLAAVGSQPTGDGINVDAITDENALLAHVGVLFPVLGRLGLISDDVADLCVGNVGGLSEKQAVKSTRLTEG